MTCAVRVISVVLLASCVAAPAVAEDRRIDVQWSVGSSYYTGRVGAHSSGSVGTQVTQGIQFGWIGATVTLGTDFHLTKQDPPPYARNLQTFHVALGTRLQVPVGDFTPSLAVEYANFAMATNPLSRFTGGSDRFHAVGGNVGLRWLLADPLFVQAQGTAHALPGMDRPTVRLGYLFSIGLSGSI